MTLEEMNAKYGKPISTLPKGNSTSFADMWKTEPVKTPQQIATKKVVDDIAGTNLSPSSIIAIGKRYISGVGESAKSGLKQTKEGYMEAVNAKNPLQLVEKSIKAASGAASAITSPIAPLLEPISQGVDLAADKISNIKGVQKFAGTKAGEVTSRVAEDVANLANIAGTVAGGIEAVGKAPGVIKGVGEKVATTATDMKTGITDAVKVIKEKNMIRDAAQVDNLAGKIVQGEATDIASAQKALSSVETKGIKTYSDLTSAFDDKIKNVSKKLDQHLEESPIHQNPLQIGDMEATIKVGDQIVRHNFVDDAINQLTDFYNKTGDITKETIMKQLKEKGDTTGLTVKEVNDLAKLHGQELNAFNANGELASGLKKQAAENTRKGLKTTAREIYGDPLFQTADNELTNLIKTRDLVKDVEAKVLNLKQKVTQRGFGEKTGRLVFQVVDKLTGGGLKGFIQSFVPRGEGLKIMNALDLERALGKNLKKLDKAINAKTELEMTKQLNDILKPDLKVNNSIINKIKNIPNKQGGFIKIGNKTIKQIDAPTKNELIQSIDYLRSGKATPSMEKTVNRLTDKYGISMDLPTNKIADLLQDLVEKTKTSDLLPGTKRGK